MQGEYAKVSDSIRSYQTGLDGVGLSEEERSTKITEQQERLAELDAAMQPLVGTTGQLAERNVEATINQTAVNQAIFDAASASGASAVQLALLGGELGIYSEAALEAALKSALIQEKIDALAAAYVSGSMSVSDMRSELATFMEGLDGAAASMIGTDEQADGLATSTNATMLGLEGTTTAAGALTSTLDSTIAGLDGAEASMISATQNADSLTGSMNSTSTSISGVTGAVGGLNSSIASIPREVNIRFNVSTHGEIPDVGSPTNKGPGGTQAAAFADGGWTGGIENEFAGSVHGQEYVFSAPAVRGIGLGNLEALHQAGKTGVINNNQNMSSHGGNTVNVYMQANGSDADVGYEVGETVLDHLRQMGAEA